VTIDLAGEHFDIPADDLTFPSDSALALRFEIDPTGVTAWTPQDS
jgi:hypothetical protein